MVKPLGLWRLWERFLFEPADVRSLAWLRMALGAYLLWYYADMFSFAHLYFFPPAVTPPPYYEPWPWLGINFVSYTTTARALAYAITVLAALGLALGFFTRVSALITWYAFASWLSFPIGRNGGDVVLATLTFITMLAAFAGHAQAALAWDAPMRFRRVVGLTVPGWTLRLYQIQLVLIYFTTGFHKSAYWVWYRGEAMYYVFQQWVWARLDLTWITHPLPIALFTYGTLFWEALLFPVLVWPRATRHWILMSGFLFHVGIAVSMRVYVFGEAMCIAYLSFIDPDWLQALCDRVWKRKTLDGKPLEQAEV